MVTYHNAFFYYYLRFMIMNPNNHPDSLWGFGTILIPAPKHGYINFTSDPSHLALSIIHFQMRGFQLLSLCHLVLHACHMAKPDSEFEWSDLDFNICPMSFSADLRDSSWQPRSSRICFPLPFLTVFSQWQKTPEKQQQQAAV